MIFAGNNNSPWYQSCLILLL